MASIERRISRQLVSVEGTATCREAARIMRDRNIGALAVRQEGRTIGLVSERDLTATVIAAGASPESPIRQIVRRVPIVPLTVSERECSDLMEKHQLRHLLVGSEEQIIGLISMRDVVLLMLDEKESLIEQLQGYISGSGPPPPYERAYG